MTASAHWLATKQQHLVDYTFDFIIHVKTSREIYMSIESVKIRD